MWTLLSLKVLVSREAYMCPVAGWEVEDGDPAQEAADCPREREASMLGVGCWGMFWHSQVGRRRGGGRSWLTRRLGYYSQY